MCLKLTTSRLSDKTFKICLYFVSYKSSTDCQWNEIPLYTTTSIKKDKKDKEKTQKKSKGAIE